MLRSEIYRTPRPHEAELPRRGDLAEVRRSHCQPESGLLVQVMNEPHLALVQCADCGASVTEYIVEVHSDHPDWQKTPGPWFYPIRWLKRIDPIDPVQYARVRRYRPVEATVEQERIANT
jgi:hypothetical protein